jgi:hypothetical protein
MAGLVRDMRAVHGRYQVAVTEVTEGPGPEVTARARIDPEAGRGQPLTVTSRYAFRDGLIFWIESLPGD